MRAQHLAINQIIDILSYIWPNVSVIFATCGSVLHVKIP